MFRSKLLFLALTSGTGITIWAVQKTPEVKDMNDYLNIFVINQYMNKDFVNSNDTEEEKYECNLGSRKVWWKCSVKGIYSYNQKMEEDDNLTPYFKKYSVFKITVHKKFVLEKDTNTQVPEISVPIKIKQTSVSKGKKISESIMNASFTTFQQQIAGKTNFFVGKFVSDETTYARCIMNGEHCKIENIYDLGINETNKNNSLDVWTTNPKKVTKLQKNHNYLIEINRPKENIPFKLKFSTEAKLKITKTSRTEEQNFFSDIKHAFVHGKRSQTGLVFIFDKQTNSIKNTN